MRSSHILRVLIIATIATVCLFVFYDTAAAQCAMCRASAGNGAFARNLNLAVVVLLAPPVSIFCAIFFIAFRNRKG
jgi:hypothetical protein